DPELRYTNTNNTPVATFSIAVDRRFQRQGEDRQADFINIVAWGKSAEFVKNYFNKGKLIGLSGRIQTRTWDDETGKRRYATEVVAEEIEFVGSKSESGMNTRPMDNTAPPVQANDGFATVDDDDDELPF
ncbi:MAG: single-stranded DNA-binding protein, partial [Clostridia bacterium]|nr:single-stranded DNA-binding protein [Clostridia bacterium]